MLIYLAQPLDQTEPQHGVGNITHLLRTVGVSWYRPGGAFALHGEPHPSEFRQLDAINQVALDKCDALVAWLPKKVPTLGVPAEIEEALRSGKPTVILTDIIGSVQLANWESRGASVVAWSHDQSLKWEAQPNEFYDLLRLRPDGRFTWNVPAANNTGELLEWTPGPLEVLELDLSRENGSAYPSRAHADDAGLDLAITNTETLGVDECRMLPTGIKAALPDGMWGLIIGRSSTWVKHRCDVRLAVIDPGYRGELMIQLDNRSGTQVTFPAGSRLAQYVLLPVWLGQVQAVRTLGEHARGENGYGSTGS